jgi:CRISPR-associated endonuclease Cas2
VKADDKRRKKQLNNSFQYLKRQGLVHVTTKTEKQGGGILITLTEKGRSIVARTRMRRVLLRPIERPAVWDGKWRLVMFDIATEDASKRSAFRRLISRLGALMLQKSVWLYPFDCTEQVDLLKGVFKLTDRELRVIVADSIGDDSRYRKHFKI